MKSSKKVVISEKIKKELNLESIKNENLTPEVIVKAIKNSGNKKYYVVQEGNTLKVGILVLG